MKHVPIIPASEITPREIYQGRREFIKVAGLGAIAGAAMLGGMSFDATAAQAPRRKIEKFTKTPFGSDEKLTPYEDVTTYNNFYEFGTGKSDPAQYAGSLVT